MLSQFLTVSSWALGTVEMDLPHVIAGLQPRLLTGRGNKVILSPAGGHLRCRGGQRYDPGQTASALGASLSSPAR